jgi:hypothetical protein
MIDAANSTVHLGASTVRHDLAGDRSWSPYLPARVFEDGVMTTLVSLKGIVKGYIRGKQRVEVLHGITVTNTRRK